MRSLQTAFTIIVIVMLTASVALAQFGLCGAPELVRIPKAQRPLLPQYIYGNQHGYDRRQAVTVEHHYHPVPITYQQPVAYQQPVQNAWLPAAQQPMAAYVWPNAAYGAPLQPATSRPAEPIPSEVNPIQVSAPPIRTNTISRMLKESRPINPIPLDGNDGLSPYTSSEGCFDSDCDSCMDSCCNYCCPWYASATALMMGRNQANGIWTTYESADLTNQMMKSDFGLKWEAGGEIRVGRRFCCDTWALEFVYWTMAPFEGMATAAIPGGTVSTTLEVTEVEFVGNGVTTNADAIFRNSSEQRLWRYDEFHNFELNLLRGGFGGCDGWPWGPQWSIGFRYLRFRDRLIYGGVMQNNTWGADGGIREAYINDHVRNNLFAFQFGFDVKTCRRRNVQLFLSPKIAIGVNHIENEYQIYRGDGVVGRPTVASGMPGSFPVSSVKDVFSLITQIDVGLDWQFARGWSARVGYRLMMATGMGLADNQIPFYIVDIPEVEDIDHNAELILHGGFAGITYNF